MTQQAKNLPDYEWTTEDSAAAKAQGWDIFESSGDTFELRLQRRDDDAVFANDEAAARHVQMMADLGHAIATRAIRALVAAGSPDIARWSLVVPAVNPSARNLVVDGTDECGNFAGDGERAPFVVFDVDRQANIAGPFDTREHGETARVAILSGASPIMDCSALQARLLAMDERQPAAQQGTVRYVVRSLSEGQQDLDGSLGVFWSNEDGWGDLTTATRFSTSERMTGQLPLSRGGDSEWMLVEEALDLSRKLPEASPMDTAMSKLKVAFGAEHEEFSRSEHQREVECGDTRLWTYWEWVVHQIEASGRTVDMAIAEATTSLDYFIADNAGAPHLGVCLAAADRPVLARWDLPAGEDERSSLELLVIGAVNAANASGEVTVSGRLTAAATHCRTRSVDSVMTQRQRSVYRSLVAAAVVASKLPQEPSEDASASLKQRFKAHFASHGADGALPVELEIAKAGSPLEWDEACREFEADGTPASTKITCPNLARHAGDIVGCGSTNVSSADEEGFHDCENCGLFFKSNTIETIAARPPQRPAVILQVPVTCHGSATLEEIVATVQALIDVGLADANSTLDDKEGDLEAAQKAVELEFGIIQPVSGPPEFPADRAVLNDAQRAVLKTYSGGDFAHLCDATSTRQLNEALDACGSGLLRFLIVELSSSEDCDTLQEAQHRLETAMQHMQEASDAIHAVERGTASPSSSASM
ncbi:hypothetical protein WT27_13635 [Burkholderia territorii]|uniref:Uncharacterized protein n=1 Tax=Burkholderia territorii TaxID=1503055 RepID=A0A125BPN4_9BURK|nr:hypothetical protein [Burkholderia territorii]KVV40959.1 hypothetical protein WT27_13635 [Burkholderia territorii]KVX33908.1 hypothetical protein WT31_09545 [Burkholderia territorii]